MGRGDDAGALKPEKVQKRPGKSHVEPGTADLTGEDVAQIEDLVISDEQDVFEERKRIRSARDKQKQEKQGESASRAGSNKKASEAERSELLRQLIARSLSGEEKMKARLIAAAGNMEYEMRTDELNLFSQDEGTLGIRVGREELFVEKKDLRRKDGSPFPFGEFVKGGVAYVGAIAISYTDVTGDDPRESEYGNLLDDKSYESIKSFLEKVRNDLDKQ
jgi:DNA-binding ferritin-like protein (Dps family)